VAPPAHRGEKRHQRVEMARAAERTRREDTHTRNRTKGTRDGSPVSLREPPGTLAIMIGFILWLLVVGLIAGFVARLLVPGRDPMGILGTIVLGVVGSFIGGFLGYVLFGKDLDEGALQASGIVGSIIGAVIALLIYRAITRRSGRRSFGGHRAGAVRRWR
jgi:uncharacterized membrane protein YeaQ/YmgE (transglycosylase-associated protein family)